MRVFRQLINAAAFAVLGTGGFIAMPAMAQANCESIQNSFAYNECLAKAGPARGQQRSSRISGTDDPEATVRSRRRGRDPRDNDPIAGGGQRGVSISRRSNRRVSAVIDPWAALGRAPSRRR